MPVKKSFYMQMAEHIVLVGKFINSIMANIYTTDIYIVTRI